MAIQSGKIQLPACRLQTHGSHYRIGILRRHRIGYTFHGFQKHFCFNPQLTPLILRSRCRKLCRIQRLILIFDLVSLDRDDIASRSGNFHLSIRQVIDQVKRPFRNDEGFPLCALYLRLNGHFHIAGD